MYGFTRFEVMLVVITLSFLVVLSIQTMAVTWQIDLVKINNLELRDISTGLRREFFNDNLAALDRQPGGLTAAANLNRVFPLQMTHGYRLASPKPTNPWGDPVVLTATSRRHYIISEYAPRGSCKYVVIKTSSYFSNVTVNNHEVEADGDARPAGRYHNEHLSISRFDTACRKSAIANIAFAASIPKTDAPSAHPCDNSDPHASSPTAPIGSVNKNKMRCI